MLDTMDNSDLHLLDRGTGSTATRFLLYLHAWVHRGLFSFLLSFISLPLVVSSYISLLASVGSISQNTLIGDAVGRGMHDVFA